MSLALAAITPHPPILIPAIGKENIKQLEKTKLAFKKLKDSLIEDEVETIIIISPHGPCQSNAFTMDLNDEFEVNFKELSDLVTKFELKSDVELAYKIRERFESRAPMQLISQKCLDHGAGIPLHELAKDLDVKIIPIYPSSELNLKTHFEFGQLLKREILIHNKKIAVIASGDLSHRLSKNSPGGYSPKGAKFDKKIIEILNNKRNSEIFDIDEKLIEDAGECGLKAIVILLGILDQVKYNPQILAYESPFGIGYLTMNFEL